MFPVLYMLKSYARAEHKLWKQKQLDEAQEWADELLADLDKQERLSMEASGEIECKDELVELTGEVMPKHEEMHMSQWDELMKKSASKWILWSHTEMYKSCEYHYQTEFMGAEVVVWTSCDPKLNGYSKGKGEDAIRVCVPGRWSKRVFRTPGWEARVQKAVQEAKRLIKEKGWKTNAYSSRSKNKCVRSPFIPSRPTSEVRI